MVSQGIVDYSVSSQDMSSVEMFQMTKQDPTKPSSSETMMLGEEETASSIVDKTSPSNTMPRDEKTASSSVNKTSPADTMPRDEETASGDVDQTSPANTTTEDVQTASGDVDKMSPTDTTPGDERDIEASKKPSPQPKDETPTKIQPK